jgi:hypothetical protein
VTVGSALAIGLQRRDVERTATFYDPFNNPYQSVRVESERPYMSAGVAAAVAVTAAGALEAYLHARRAGGGAVRSAAASGGLQPIVSSDAEGTRVGVSLSRR